MAQLARDTGVRNWTPDRLPDLTGRRVLITGGNTGLGFQAAKLLAKRNADIVIACRNPDKATAAVTSLAPLGAGSAEAVTLDLSLLASVRAAADEIGSRYADGLDAIINNAGIMQTPQARSADGFELQLATNHFGHFLFNGILFPLVEARAGRLVAVSSIAHKPGKIYLDDLTLADNYSPIRAYGQSKLANLLYALELDRRLRAAGSSVSALACHPGYAATDLQSTGPRGALKAFYKVANRLIAQSASAGAVPLALAAAGTEAESGAFYGPTGIGGAHGKVGDSTVNDAALDHEIAAGLWAESERLVGFNWDTLLPAKATKG